jgi:hypothetical protein
MPAPGLDGLHFLMMPLTSVLHRPRSEKQQLRREEGGSSNASKVDMLPTIMYRYKVDGNGNDQSTNSNLNVMNRAAGLRRGACHDTGLK